MPAPSAVALLSSPAGIRERTAAVLRLAREDRTPHFVVDARRLSIVASRIAAAARELPSGSRRYGRMDHFDADGVPRTRILDARLAGLDRLERARAKVDLVVTSVLLDAGAGAAWTYVDAGHALARSEGLAVATFRAFLAGAFAGDRSARVDADGLARLDAGALAEVFQVRADNPLDGLGGRLRLLRGLEAALRARPDLFGAEGRPGGLVDVLRARGREVSAGAVLALLVDALGPMWPPRGGAPELSSLGDVWPYAPLGVGDDALVPFHKLLQWLVHSISEPLSEAGVEITRADELTALAEYRTGGLLLDLGVLRPRSTSTLAAALHAGDEAVVEWRALTVALLGEVAAEVRALLGLEAGPAAAALLGRAAWAAGRAEARARRAGGEPPIRIDTEGTVF
jgi:hypothetical protein